MSVLSIKTIIDNQVVTTPVAPTRRNFATCCFVFKGTEVNSSRVNYYTSYEDIVTAYGSNSEPVKAAATFFSGGFNGIKPTQLFIANYDQTGGETLNDLFADLFADSRYVHIAYGNTFTEAQNLTAASAVEALTKTKFINWQLSDDTEIETTTLANDTGSVAKVYYTNKYTKTLLVYDDTAQASEYKQVSAMSYFATVGFNQARPLGQLAFKQESAITATASITDNYAANLIEKRVNFYAPFGEANRDVFYKGQVPSGLFIDTVIGSLWIDYNITYNIYDLLVRLPRVGYNYTDFNKIASVISSACQQAVDAGFLAPGTDSLTGKVYLFGYKVEMPDPANVTLADKQAGLLNNIVVKCLLNGNVVKIELTTYLNN